MRTVTDRSSSIDDTTFYATLIKSDIGHGDYMQPRWFFCVNRSGR